MTVLCFWIALSLCATQSWARCSGITDAGNVQGNNNGWTHIGSVKNGSVIRIVASGKVDFGCRACSCVDSAGAGVTHGNILGDIKDAGQALVDPRKTYETFKQAFSHTQEPHFNQGGVWIKIVTKSLAPYLGTQLYYYWEHGVINKIGLSIFEDVDVYAKAHDGGKSPDATKGYGDNKGAYTVRVEYLITQGTTTISWCCAGGVVGQIQTADCAKKGGHSYPTQAEALKNCRK